MDTCLNCGAELHHAEGRKKKTFCSPKCRSVYWHKNRPKEPKYVLYETHKKALDEIAALKEKLAEMGLVPTIVYEQPGDYDQSKKAPYIQDEYGQSPTPSATTLPGWAKKPIMFSPKDAKAYDAPKSKKVILDEVGACPDIPPPLTLAEIKAMCPPELKGIERSTWIAQKRAEYGI